MNVNKECLKMHTDVQDLPFVVETASLKCGYEINELLDGDSLGLYMDLASGWGEEGRMNKHLSHLKQNRELRNTVYYFILHPP